MIERYKTNQMEAIWCEAEKFRRWSRVEIAACSVLCFREEINEEILEEISSTEAPSPEKVAEYEVITNHDVVAFINAFTENMSEEAQKAVHRGLTSSDVCDTALSLGIRESINILITSLKEFSSLLEKKAIQYKNLPCIGRTHGVHAEPSVFGLKFLGWKAECDRNLDRLVNVYEEINYGKLSGVVGTYSQNDPLFESDALEELFMNNEDVATQIIPRDRHACVMSVLALIGAMIERIALEIRSLQRTEVGEVEECFKIKQTGSSAMPHKHNPILSERLCGLSRILRGYMTTAYENIALWHERDISHSSVERIIIPDAFHLAHYGIQKCINLIENLIVFEDRVKDNINKTNGMIFSQNILTWLISKGYTRKDAYEIVQTAASKVNDDYNMKQAICDILPGTENELDEIMKVDKYLQNINEIYKRL